MTQLLIARSICDGIPHDSWVRAPPKNFYTIPNTSWPVLKQLSFQSNDVVAFEVTCTTQDNCKGVFLDLAREHEGLMFYRIVFEKPEAVPADLNADFGIHGCFPIFALAYFSDNGMEVLKFEGEADIDTAVVDGVMDAKITNFLEKRALLKISQLQSKLKTPQSPLSTQMDCCEVPGQTSSLSVRGQKRALSDGAMDATTEGRQHEVLIQNADTTQLEHNVSVPQLGVIEVDHETSGSGGLEDEEVVKEGDHTGEPSTFVPVQMPEKLHTKISNLLETFQEQKSSAKSPQRSLVADYDNEISDIIADCDCDKNLRAAVVQYLATKMGVTCKTLYKRARVNQQKKQFQDLLQKLREAIREVMPEQLSNHQKALAANKYRKKYFTCSPQIRTLVCEIVSHKLDTGKKLLSKEKLIQFLEDEIAPLWPKGWMCKSILLKYSQCVHVQYFINSPIKATPKKGKSLASSSTDAIMPGLERPPQELPELTLCEPLEVD